MTRKKSVRIRNFASLLAAGCLAAFGMGSSCPGTGSSASFTSPTSTATNAVTFSKFWHTPVFVDLGAVNEADATQRISGIQALNNNMAPPLPGTNSVYPMAIFNDAPGSFYAIFNRIVGAAPSDISMFAIQNPSVSSQAWVGGFSSFTQLDSSPSIPPTPPNTVNSQRPLGVVDSAGNSTVVMFTGSSGGGFTNTRPFALRKSVGNTTWNSPIDISKNADPLNATNSASLGADADNDAVALWEQSSHAYFNECIPNVGWRFTGGIGHVVWSTAADDTHLQDLGVDAAFDSFGNGWAAYVANPGAITHIEAARWRTDLPGRFNTTDIGVGAFSMQNISGAVNLAGGTVYGYPRVVAANNGAASIFFYANHAGNFADLWVATAGAAPTGAPVAFNPATQVDVAVGVGQVFMNDASPGGGDMPPVVSHTGNMAALAFIKSDGIARRVFVFKSVDGGQTWGQLLSPDLGGLNADVWSVSAAIDPSGNIAAVWSANGPIDNNEHVYANYYNATFGRWQGVAQIDLPALNLFTLEATGAAGNQVRPYVSIDNNGNAVAGFSMLDASVVGGTHVRRAAVTMFQ